MSESETVKETTCQERMSVLMEKIGLMIQPIQDGIKRIEADIAFLKNRGANFVLRDDYERKCEEIKDLKSELDKIKAFMNKSIGGLIVLQILIAVLDFFVKK